MAQIQTSGREASANRAGRPNILILCMDQWQTHMQVPEDVEFPATRRLEARGVSFDRQYCTVPICTPSRATMWTGVHAKQAGLSDNTNFAWIHELSSEIPTIGHLMREQGYYTAFKGKWHLSEVPRSEDALERYGFSDLQQWGEMFGTPCKEKCSTAPLPSTPSIGWRVRRPRSTGRGSSCAAS
jgi:arylsulfatase A-like enzyme